MYVECSWSQSQCIINTNETFKNRFYILLYIVLVHGTKKETQINNEDS